MGALWSHLPALQIVIPLLGGLLAALLRRGVLAFGVTLVVSWLMPVVSAVMLHQVLNAGPISYALGGWPPPWGIEYRVDVLNAFVLVLISSIGAVIVPFARRSVAFEVGERRAAWFYCMYLMCLTGLLGVTVTGDAFNAFVFLEISSLSTYVLIALGKDRRALVAAFRYLVMGTIGATFYVIGVGFLYLLTGSLNMVDIAARLAASDATSRRRCTRPLFVSRLRCRRQVAQPMRRRREMVARQRNGSRRGLRRNTAALRERPEHHAERLQKVWDAHRDGAAREALSRHLAQMFQRAEVSGWCATRNAACSMAQSIASITTC
ncbi:MAG: hypothetical protein HC861_04535 [Rhodospirillaceae bacterium]|nr:hypothetical protein [Rhodospirillaceae bacterium]